LEKEDSLSSLGGVGGKRKLIPCSAETGTDLFPTVANVEVFPPSVFCCAGENMGPVENSPSGSVWGCSAPPAALWKTLSTVCTGCFSKDLMALLKTTKKKKREKRE